MLLVDRDKLSRIVRTLTQVDMLARRGFIVLQQPFQLSKCSNPSIREHKHIIVKKKKMRGGWSVLAKHVRFDQFLILQMFKII